MLNSVYIYTNIYYVEYIIFNINNKLYCCYLNQFNHNINSRELLLDSLVSKITVYVNDIETDDLCEILKIKKIELSNLPKQLKYINFIDMATNKHNYTLNIKKYNRIAKLHKVENY